MSDNKLFEGLKESIKDAGKFMRGEDVPGLTLHTVAITPVDQKKGRDLQRIRKRFGLSQGAMAEILGVSRKTVETWQQ
jgi:DNA-binding transcriptional regulator YiaG